MNKISLSIALLSAFVLAGSALGQAASTMNKPEPRLLLFDFEQGTEEWRIDWGCSGGGPEASKDEAHHGKGSLTSSHIFGVGDESSALAVGMQSSKDLRGYKLTAWVYLPKGSGTWQGQLYVRCGKDDNPVFGRLKDGLKDGWNQLEMDSGEMTEPEAVQEIGVQLKNWTQKTETKFFVDEIEAVSPQ